jgi:hypothetical protein
MYIQGNLRSIAYSLAVPRWIISACAVAVLVLAQPALGITIVSLNPELTPGGGASPINFTYAQAPGFQAGPGSVGNGDGNLLPGSQSAPGLELKTPLTINDPAVFYGRTLNADGSTTFYDTTLVMTNLTASTIAQQINVGGILFDFQTLGSGTFSIYNSAPGGFISGNSVLLLQGTITTSTINGLDATTTGSVLSNTVTYTGGVIYNALIAHNGNPNGGSATFNLSLLPGSTFAISGSNMLPFNATGQAIFNVVAIPEPGTMALAAIGGLTLAVPAYRRWRRRARV